MIFMIIIFSLLAYRNRSWMLHKNLINKEYKEAIDTTADLLSLMIAVVVKTRVN